jgi:hypothetical protein
LLRHIVAAAPFYSLPDNRADLVGELQAGDELWMLDDTRGWAWGYGGPDCRVGYVRSEAVGL